MSAPRGGPGAGEINHAYYDREQPGREDYRRYMAAPRWRMRLLLGALAGATPARLADLGCATGAVVGELRAAFPGARFTGLDLSPAQIEANRRREPDGDWQVADLSRPDELPAGLLGCFDTLVSTEVIEHLDDPGALLRCAARLGAPGARLLLTTQSGPVRETERRVGHIRHFTGAELSALLRANGWRPVRVWNAGWPFHDLSKWVANRDPDSMMERFSERPYGWRERFICWGLRIAFRFNSNRRGAQLFALAEKA